MRKREAINSRLFPNTSPLPLEPRERFNAVHPYDPQAQHYAAFNTPQLDVNTLPSTFIENILGRQYLASVDSTNINSVVSLADIVKHFHTNVGALCLGSSAVATGILITPELFLTTRHSVEFIQAKLFSVTFDHYISNSDKRHYYLVDTILEAPLGEDFVILKLANRVSHFKEIKCDFTKDYQGPTILIHHSDGKPKQVSVHASVTHAHYDSLIYSGFHDSEPGASGAVYINTHKQVLALHQLYQNGTTGALWLQNIRNKSVLLKWAYDNNGNYIAHNKLVNAQLIQNLCLIPYNLVHRQSSSLAYLQFLESSVNRPQSMPALSGANLARHHIIPLRYMKLLWEAGEIAPAIKTVLLELVHEKATYSIEEVTWVCWNLFEGPLSTYRSDDPNAEIESVPPLGFNQDLYQELKTNLFPALDSYEKSRSAAELTSILTTLQAIKALNPCVNNFHRFNPKEWRQDHNNKWEVRRKPNTAPKNTPGASLPQIK